MFGLDEAIAELGAGGSVLLVVLVAVLLGLRHATDPDHVTAVSTLIVADEDHSPRRTAWLGLSWGLGHATTLLALGLPFVLFGSLLPEPAQVAAEVLIAVVIVALAIRVLVRWRRGLFHSHPHRHGDLVHAHPHAHGHAHVHAAAEGSRAPAHEHPHAESVRRSPLGAYGIGLVHGVGGSAGVGLLLLATIDDRSVAVLALVLFVLFTAIAMAAASTTVGWGLNRPRVRRSLPRLAPALGALSLAFGVWYGLGALAVVPYAF
jgi:ABC-type nickel/cobalt efflux system permease component RcnA